MRTSALECVFVCVAKLSIPCMLNYGGCCLRTMWVGTVNGRGKYFVKMYARRNCYTL